jgi:hypothetical protein
MFVPKASPRFALAALRGVLLVSALAIGQGSGGVVPGNRDSQPEIGEIDAGRDPSGNTRNVAKSTASGSLDMTELARRFAPHRGPTRLYINFDGWNNRDKKGHRIQPFRATTRSRDRDIQEILYRTSEIFAPFNVQVVRITGDGNYDKGSVGNTTVFVGGDTARINGKGEKYVEAVTPGKHLDYPHPATSTSHQPNSDPYDIAFVDPMLQGKDGGWSNAWNNTIISRKIAHESGHTFGLAHIVSNGYPDLMSYDTEPRSHFANRTFPVTDLNFNAVKKTKDHNARLTPKWHEQTISTENTFTYLMAVLGPRTLDDYPNVADATAVDGGYREGSAARLAPGSTITGAIAPRGDYDLFRLQVPAGNGFVAKVRPSPGSSLRPVLLMFDGSGKKLVTFATSRNSANGSCQIPTPAGKGATFKIVVGAVDGASTGTYELTVSEPEIQTVSRLRH